MFIIIRLIIGCIFLGFAILIIRKSRLVHKRIQYIVSTIISAMLAVALVFLPFENLFITFDSPQEVYEYVNFGESDVKLVINGNNSDLVIGDKNGSDIYLIVPKTMNGWKIGINSDTKRIVQENSKGIIIYVYQYKNTNDYFITILDTNGGESQILDSIHSKFYHLEKTNDSLGKTFVTYYAYISNFNSQYWISVNDNRTIQLIQ